MWDLKNCAFIRLDKPEYVPEKNPISTRDEMLNDILLFGLFMPIEICEV